MTERCSRRRLLAGSALAATGALAGCLGNDGGDGSGGGGDGTGDDGPPTYARWLPERERLGGEDWNYRHYDFFDADFATVREHESAFDGGVYDEFESADEAFPLSTAGVDFEAVARVTTVGDGIARVDGEFGRDEVVDALGEAGLDSEDEYEGYEIHVDPGTAAVAVGDGTLLGVPRGGSISPEDFVPIVRTLVDTGTGTAPRQVDTNPDFERLVGALGEGTFVDGTTRDRREAEDADPAAGDLVGTVARGKAVIVEGETTTIRHVRVLSSAEDVDMDAVDEWIENGFLTEALTDPTAEQRDRTVVVEGTVPTDISGFGHYVN